jgi:hypothetical protein
MLEWSAKQQNERKMIDSLYVVVLDKLSTPRDNNQLTFLESYLSQIMTTLNDSKLYNRQTHVAVDSVILELDTIQKVLERSQYKTAITARSK